MSDSGNPSGDEGLYIVLVSVHGLIRGQDLELGRDADTGGQTLYVVELARALAEHPKVDRVDLLTRRVIDPKVSDDYAEPVEELSEGARIVRLDCGPRRYLRKEVLWPHLGVFADRALYHIREVGRVPDVVHSHYADAGLVGGRLADLLGVPLVHTGHSLGRDKKARLLERGLKESRIEEVYNMSQRIEAEEATLDRAALVIASTQQEVETQYAQYDNYQPKRMRVIPPGVDLSRFRPPRENEGDPTIRKTVNRFLREPRKPMIVAMSRADERKNMISLVRAYGENLDLQEMANLVLVAGTREDIEAMEKGPRDVLTQLLLAIDRYDLYGRVAYPKQHRASDVPHIYRMAARSRGLFVNPALTEPFGLTLIEAAASGLPIIATRDGGPRDILANCRNGQLIDPYDVDSIANALREGLGNRRRWRRWSENGSRGAHEHYSWSGHSEKYVREVEKVLQRFNIHSPSLAPANKSRLPTISRLAVADLDDTLLGDDEALSELLSALRRTGRQMGFGVATGRTLKSTLGALKNHGLPTPDVLITSAGTNLHYGHKKGRIVADSGWHHHLDYQWQPEAIRRAMAELPGLKLQPKREQDQFKISYYMDSRKAPRVRDIRTHLRQHDIHVTLSTSHGAYLDVLPIRAGKGSAVRYIAFKWGLPMDHVLVAGDSEDDEEMLVGDNLAVVVGNHSEAMERLRDRAGIYMAEGQYAWGILEGLRHYGIIDAEGRSLLDGENEAPISP
ncbi:MAG: HAD-IIB family hydrolase [Pseudomonadota bacterium]